MPTLTVQVHGLRSAGGVVRAGLYPDAAHWLKPEDSPQVSGVTATPRGATASCVFPDVRPGTYAVAVFHDENHNEKLDTNFLRLPTEGFGFSRVERLGLGQPSYADASFHVGDADLTVQVKMIYLLPG